MAIRRPPLSNILVQMELNRFYENPITQVSLSLVFSVLCIAFFAVFAIRPTLLTMAGLIKEIEEKTQIDQKLTTKITNLQRAQQELVSKESTLSLLNIAIPSTPYYSQLLTVFEKLASEKSVIFTSATAQKVPLEEQVVVGIEGKNTIKLESIPLTLTFKGPYEQLVILLAQLQNTKRLITVDRFDISPEQTDDESTGQLLLTVSVRAFTFTKK